MFTVNPPLGGMSQNSGVHSESGGKVAGSREELLGSLFSDPSISNKHVKDLVAGRLTRQSAHDLLDVLTEIDVTTCDGPDEPGLTIRPVIAHLFRTASDKQAFRDILIDYGKSKLQEKFGSADPKELYRKSLGGKEIRQLNSFQWLCAIGLDRKGVAKSKFARPDVRVSAFGGVVVWNGLDEHWVPRKPRRRPAVSGSAQSAPCCNRLFQQDLFRVGSSRRQKMVTPFPERAL